MSVEPESRADPVIPATPRRHSILVYLSMAWLVLIIAFAVFADLLPISPAAVVAGKPKLPPALGELDLLLGTDNLGRSMLSRSLYGARASLVVGAVAGLVGFALGTVLGLVTGHLRGKVDTAISVLSDAMLAFPPLILLLVLSTVLTPSVPTLLIGLTLLVIPSFARLGRANTLPWSSREFVLAARNMGAGNARIMVREILPNVVAPLATYLPIVVAALIVAEGSLSYLGLGIPPPTPSWGGMIADGQDSLATAPHLVFVPAAVIFATVFALNQLGDHLRVRFDRTLHD
ncbi:ABC transporter permease [Amycolatopsis sp. YIM 10]|uniref:ABC transporter permease n=1 Tax=Amycolatopsis sp. YIM 10 TaxID=2653857 RepID=UPI0012907CC2|nr:ABC transporter permease [Amycolatopsis sp. YIM 10]QFU92503.1 Glutathione transport system permease protein GsiD [Amycolatopsis sp. YIM 10]